MLQIIVEHFNQSNKPHCSRVWGEGWWGGDGEGGGNNPTPTPPPFFLFFRASFSVVTRHDKCLTPHLFYFTPLPHTSYSYLLEAASINMLTPPPPPTPLLILPHNCSHLRPRRNCCHRGCRRLGEGGGLFTFLLHLVHPPLDIISYPLLLLLLQIGFPLRYLVLDVVYALIPHTVPQNFPHYCNFVIFVVINFILDLYASLFSASIPIDLDTILLSDLTAREQKLVQLSVCGREQWCWYLQCSQWGEWSVCIGSDSGDSEPTKSHWRSVSGGVF